VRIEYQKEIEEPAEWREIEPYFAFFTGDFWYVHAWCRKREAQRTFSLDKIKRWELTDIPFFGRDEIPPPEDIRRTIGPYVSEKLEEVVVRFSPEVKQYFFRRKWTRDQEVRKLSEGWIEVRFRVKGLEGIKHWLYRWIPYFEVVSPPELVQEIREDLSEFLRKNSHFLPVNFQEGEEK